MRPMDMLTTTGRQVVTPDSQQQASWIGKHWNVTRAVLVGRPGARAELAAFAKLKVGGFQFEWDADVVIVEGLRGELTLDSIYVQGS
jgi:hypothetical protein